MTNPSLENLLREDRTFPPPEAFRANALASDEAIYDEADKDPEAWWAGHAERLRWTKPWERTLEWNPPFAKWFVGAEVNTTYNCVDRHAGGSRAQKPAIIWEGEPGDTRVLTYRELLDEVQSRGGDAQAARRAQRRQDRHLHADDSGGSGGDARMCPPRRSAHGGLWRLLPQIAGRPHQRLPGAPG